MINPKGALQKIISIDGSPEYIAKGFALGSFIGMIPIPGFQILISVAVASLMKVSKKAAGIGALNTNLVTGVFIFAFNYWLGKKILGVDPSFVIPNKVNWEFTRIILNEGSDVFMSLLVGGLITGVIVAYLSYLLIKHLVQKRQKKTASE